MKIFAQKLLVGRTFLANQTVTVEDGQITAIGGGGPADFSVWALTPGLVDLHCHGGQGFDPELNERPLPEFLTILLCHGVTDVLLTLGAEPLPTMRRALAVVQTAMQQQAAGKLPGAHILGVHLEGPFLSPERPGAMPPAALLPPTLAAYQTLVQGYESVIRQVTLAPELPGALELGAALAARGIRVQAGHTDADYETAQRAFSAGFTGLCHTFNACRPLRHRDPGVVAAALLDPNVTTECICDLVHLHPAALQLVSQLFAAGFWGGAVLGKAAKAAGHGADFIPYLEFGAAGTQLDHGTGELMSQLVGVAHKVQVAVPEIQFPVAQAAAGNLHHYFARPRFFLYFVDLKAMRLHQKCAFELHCFPHFLFCCVISFFNL